MINLNDLNLNSTINNTINSYTQNPCFSYGGHIFNDFNSLRYFLLIDSFKLMFWLIISSILINIINKVYYKLKKEKTIRIKGKLGFIKIDFYLFYELKDIIRIMIYARILIIGFNILVLKWG